MAIYESLTYTRQEAFDVEPDLRCEGLFQMNDNGDDHAVMMAYQLYKNAPLIGEFAISPAGRNEMLKEGRKAFRKLCEGKWELQTSQDQRMAKRVLVTACVLLARSILKEAEKSTGDTEKSKVWPLIFEGLGFRDDYGCSREVAQNRLYALLRDRDALRFSTEDGQKYYNTLRFHALMPESSIQNLYNILYGFYHKNLDCTYEPGSNAARVFVESMCKRWEAGSQPGKSGEKIASDWIASSQKELFRQRPRYMAALCDALLEKIDRIVQGDLTHLREQNRWDRLLKKWYLDKTDYEKQRMQHERRAVVRTKIVDRVEQIQPEYRLEDGKLCIFIPGIRLPQIRQELVLQLFQNEQLVNEKVTRLQIHGSELLYHSRPYLLQMEQEPGINWKMRPQFAIRILSGDQEIYHSGTTLYWKDDYLCFGPGGNQTRLIRCEQTLRLVTCKMKKPVIDDPNNQYRVIPAPYHCVSLRMDTVRGVTFRGRQILEEMYSNGKRFWAGLVSEEEYPLEAKRGQETLTVYTRRPELCVEVENREEGKNYQLTLQEDTRQLYEYPWWNGQFHIPLPEAPEQLYQVQLKDFDTGAVKLQRSYMVIPGLRCRFDRPWYPDRETDGTLFVETGSKALAPQPFRLQPGQDTVTWQLDGMAFESKVPKVTAELKGRNAFLLPEHLWHSDWEDAFLSVRVPEEVSCTVFFGGALLEPNSSGYYEIGTELVRRSQSLDDALLGLLLCCGGRRQEETLTVIHSQEVLLSDPVVQNGRQLLWRPQLEDYVGGDGKPTFRVDLENDQGEPWPIVMGLKPRELDHNFNCKPGIYHYTIWLTNRSDLFMPLPDRMLLRGEIRIEDPPEERFRNKYLDLTYAYYQDPITQRDVRGRMRWRSTEIHDIQYMKSEEKDGQTKHIYKARLYLGTKSGPIPFNDEETDLYYKINPIYFTPEPDGSLSVWKSDGESLELNLESLVTKPYDSRSGAKIFSKKSELTTAYLQDRFWTCADGFCYQEYREMR